jgi:hypothetical protein
MTPTELAHIQNILDDPLNDGIEGPRGVHAHGRVRRVDWQDELRRAADDTQRFGCAVGANAVRCPGDTQVCIRSRECTWPEPMLHLESARLLWTHRP